MALAIFDLDNTILAGDSDYLWGQFLCENGVVDRDTYEAENRRYYDEYKAGHLDIFEFQRFSLRPLVQHDTPQLKKWRARFMVEKIEPIITKAAVDLVERHRAAGDTLLIITATNAFVTYPIADRFNIPHLIATEPERVEGHFTGLINGIPSFREGKVQRLHEWLDLRDESLDDSWFYSDSHNDLPLLELVTHPVAVNPDEQLAAIANERGWPIMKLHT